ncbi:MAG: winged helix-turn-helix transcriptional regulator [Actinomycetota bacterium]
MSPKETPRPLEEAAERVGDRWVLLVVDALLDGPRKFGELAGTVAGIAPNILSERLRRLESDGLVISRPYSRRPLRLMYELTAPGRELTGTLKMLAQWGARRSGEEALPIHHACGTGMEARWFCPTCSHVVDEAEMGDLFFA